MSWDTFQLRKPKRKFMCNYNPVATPEYIKTTITILHDCGIELNAKQIEEINALPTEMAVDCYKRKLIFESIDRR